MYESDANNSKNFHTLPDHIKKILYLDAPDIIVELNTEPIFSIEVSQEAGTGHNAFQRFARLAASVENDVPAFYIYPEAALITRSSNNQTVTTWDRINPLVFKALDDVMTIYKIPALLYYFPSDFRSYSSNPNKAPNQISKGLKRSANRTFAACPDENDYEMQQMFSALNEIILEVEKVGVLSARSSLLSKRTLSIRKSFMQGEYANKGGNLNMSPLSATQKISTNYLLNYLARYESSDYKIGELLRSRDETIIYKIDAAFRGDPYPGALAAIDYLACREGKTFEDRKYNLVLCWGDLKVLEKEETIQITSEKSKIDNFISAVESSEAKNLLSTKSYSAIRNSEVSRYYMQVRYGSMFSKVKHIRVFSYFADAILFKDGALWRDA